MLKHVSEHPAVAAERFWSVFTGGLYQMGHQMGYFPLTLMRPGTQVLIPYIRKILHKLYRKIPI